MQFGKQLEPWRRRLSDWKPLHLSEEPESFEIMLNGRFLQSLVVTAPIFLSYPVGMSSVWEGGRGGGA